VLGMTRFLNRTATELATSATELAASISEQEKVVSQQATSVNQVTTTLEELGASSRQSAEQAVTSASSAQKALEISTSGSGTVQRTLEGIDILKENVYTIAQKIMELTEQTAQISTISDLVADIANQTNILALNAAVEAARAGEQGKGFSVVAQEIRKLADQSKKSAEKISSLVRDIQSSINSTVMVTDEGTKTATEGIRLSKATSDTFQDIINAIQSISVNSQQIALSAKQQAVGVQQGVSAMNAINLGAQEVASSISQLRSAIQQLSESAQLLREQV
jgi:Methyl-accepting chemotaxis protein